MTDEHNITQRDRWFIGADKDLRFTIYADDEDTTPRVAEDITGWSLQLVVTFGDDIVITKATGGSGIALTDPSNGVAVVTIDDTDTDSLTPGEYRYELWRTDAGNEDVLSFGRISLRETRRVVA